MKNIKTTALALILGCLTVGQSKAEVWTPPTLEQVGYNYYYYLEYAHESTLTYALPAATAQAALAPFGVNIAAYAWAESMSINESYFHYYLGYSEYHYYLYLADLYAYQNYQNPAYAQQLESFYTNYAALVYDYHIANYYWIEDYYNDISGYYYNLVWP